MFFLIITKIFLFANKMYVRNNQTVMFSFLHYNNNDDKVDLTCACVKVPLVAIWSSWVSHLSPLPMAQVRSTNGWLCLHFLEELGETLNPFTCYKRWDTREQSKGRVLRDLCVFIRHRWASLIHHSLESTPLDCTKSCDIVPYKPLLDLAYLYIACNRDQ